MFKAVAVFNNGILCVLKHYGIPLVSCACFVSSCQSSSLLYGGRNFTWKYSKAEASFIAVI